MGTLGMNSISITCKNKTVVRISLHVRSCDVLFESCTKLRKCQTTLAVLSHGTQTIDLTWWQKMD